jgi:predicted CXXCH cytochrome family protein
MILLLAIPGGPAFGVVANTRHNLSASGPGTVRAATESQICIFCHTPHNAAPNSPLWNRRNPGSTYTPYSSSTAVATPGQPTGASILCLSCHDGTIALGEVLSLATPISMAGGVTTMPTGPGRLGTDLSDDHPISFAYTATLATQRGELVSPSALTGPVRLDAGGQMQCTACHNAHDDTNGKFLTMPNRASALCQTCHTKNYWSQTAHRTSTATWNNAGTDPWPVTAWTNVADNACENCHRPHSAPGRQRLLHSATEETVCFTCHNGNVASRNIQSEFNKASIHPLTSTTGAHQPREAAVATSRHIECVDCHNPHASRSGSGNPPGPLTGVRGVGLTGAEVTPATYEYQVCFRCHADSPGKPAARTPRQLSQTNVRLEFDTVNPSYHPVAGPGRNSNVPSLIAPLTTASTITCGDCHNNNSGPRAGGTGPAGPHGSAYVPLLVRQYLTSDNTAESSTSYALCYNCHSRTSILGNQSFPLHNMHVSGERAPCNICHDPHGISATQGNSTNNSRLINFDTSVVSASSSGILRFESTGTLAGRCYLRCHGQNHNPCSYGGGAGNGTCGMGGGM